MNLVVVVVRWWQTDQRGEDVLEFLEKQEHQVECRQGMDCGEDVARSRALPNNPVVKLPAAHTSVVEIPQDWSQCV
jgi:hypothetical protein